MKRLHFKPKLMVVALLVLIWVACSKDNEPTPLTIEAQDFTVTIDENPANNSVIGVLDVTTSESANLSFDIKDQQVQNALSVEDDGTIFINDSSIFDFEIRNEFTASYYVAAGSTRDSASITITINDIDELEINANDFTVEIAENPENGRVLGTVDAQANDGTPLNFTITDQAVAGALAIDDQGQVIVSDSAVFDFEINQQITANYTASAQGIEASASIEVNITDLNEVAELIANDFAVQIEENPANGFVLGTVDASINNGKSLSYSITSQSASNAVTINASTGELAVGNASVYDFETHTTIQAGYRVTDGEFTATAAINITITNDPSDDPSITVNDFKASVDENPANGDILGTVDATHSQGANLTFSLTDNASGAIAINGNNGELTVADASAFDYEKNPSLTGSYSVTDGVITESANITITINDLTESKWETLGGAGFTPTARHVELVISGAPMLAYHDYSNVKIMWYNGSSWDDLGNTICGNATGIHLVENGGDVYIAYPNPDLGTTSHKAAVKKYDRTSSWVAVGGSGFSPGNASSLRLAFSNAGTPTVIYEENGSNDPNVQTYDSYYDHWNSPVGGTSNGIEPSLSEYTSGTDLAINPNQNRWYVAYSVNSISNRVRVKYWANLNDNGAKWHYFGNLSGGSTDQNIIEFDANGVAYVLYKDADYKLYMESRASSGSSWSVLGGGAISPVLSGSPGVFDFIMIDNTPYVVYEDGANFKLSIKKWDGASWVSVSENFASGTYPDLAYDAVKNEIYVAFADGNHSQRVTVMKMPLDE